MAISTINDVISARSAGRWNRYDWQKQTGGSAYTAGRWYEMASLAGLPVATTFPGTALTYVPCNEATGDGTNTFGMYHGGDVSAMVKHLINATYGSSVATAVPSTIKFVDMLGYWPGINMNANTLQTLTGTPSLTRATSGNGVRMFLTARSTTGATGHNLSYSYTNQAGTSGRTQPFTVACTASAITPHILHSGTAANNYGPFLPLANGDYGIQNVASVQLSAASGSASTAALVLCRPLFDITIGVAGLQTEKDLLNQFPSLPNVPDGACIVPLLFAGAAVAGNTNFQGSLETIWG